VTPAFSSEVLARLSDWATAEFGLRFPPDRWNELARGIASAALELGIADLEGWAAGLPETLPREHLKTIANHLTISETYFFRHRETFTALEREIFPTRIAERRQHAQVLRIWSAGCASGEEPYSVAILLRQRFPDFRPEQVAITATDINSRVLARAQRAIYSEWSFRDVSDVVKQGWFDRKPNGRYEVVPEIRKMVRFVQLNFAAAHYPAEFGERGDFDLILCRNVLMYFSAEWQERIVRRLTDALAPGGWLIVGPCDLTAAQSAALVLQQSSPGIYQKVSADQMRRPAEFGLTSMPPNVSGHTWRPAEMPVPERAGEVAPLEQWSPVVEPVPPASSAVTGSEGDAASAMAQSHADRGELDEALAACDAAIAADKTNPSHHYLRACILQELNRGAEAAEAFRRVLFLDPHSVMAEFALGCLAEREGRREQARHHFTIVLQQLSVANRGDAVPGSDGLTVARLREVVERNLSDDAA
jgi:chemotaxis protein methyltransferase CheR